MNKKDREQLRPIARGLYHMAKVLKGRSETAEMVLPGVIDNMTVGEYAARLATLLVDMTVEASK